MGMITRDDIILALSNSGSTAEIVTLLPLIKRLGIQLISMTGNPESPTGEGRRCQPRRPRGPGGLPAKSGADLLHYSNLGAG